MNWSHLKIHEIRRSELSLPHGKMVVWIESSAHELAEEHFAKRQNRRPADWLTQSRGLWDFIIGRLNEEGYVVVDPRATIAQSFLDGGEYPFSASGHYRPIAYQLTAPVIAEKLSAVLGSSR